MHHNSTHEDNSSASSFLLEDEQKEVDDVTSLEIDRRRRHRSHLRRSYVDRFQPLAGRYVWILHLSLLSFSIMCLYLADAKNREASRSCIDRTSQYSPFLDFVEYETVRFDGSLELNPQTVWTGNPRPELDDAWQSIADGRPAMSITEEEARKAGIYLDLNSLSRFPPGKKNEGRIQVHLEWTHHLHCLNEMRKWIHRDYYDHIDDWSNADNDTDRLSHIDHCINLLRQSLMCHADTGLIFYYWIEGHDHMHMDFSTQHVCRNFDKVRERSYALGVDWESLDEFAHMIKTKLPGVVPLSDYPAKIYQEVEKDKLGHPYYL